MRSHRAVTRALAATFLAGNLETEQLVARGSHLLGKRWRWLWPLARRVVQSFGISARPRLATLVEFLEHDQGYQRAQARYELQVANLLGANPTMCPIDQAVGWEVPQIVTAAELAEWFGVSPSELQWFADVKRFQKRQNCAPIRHYHYRALSKRFGQIRLIEAPKPRLKAIQRQILESILDQVPAHDAANGFRKGGSIRTFAEPHVDQQVVVKIDLQDFFPTISAGRVHAIFRTIGYPDRVADLLTGLCVNSVPWHAWDKRRFSVTDQCARQAVWRYAKPHLPQGAPTSPALANLCAYRLDCRLTGLAMSVDATYSRYADDLAISGGENLSRVARRFQIHVCATAMEEGFRVNHRKTRIMRQGVRQQIAGLVVNKRINLSRADRDALKATLTNCVRFGPDSQNRNAHADFRSHLHGKIAFVESINPQWGAKLRKLFDRIDWSPTTDQR